MWLLKVPLFLFLIGATKSKKNSQLALEEYYQEASQIYEKANKIHLEYELATGKVGALDVAERILNKKMDASVLEEYVEMKISGGLKEQNEILELFEKAEEVKTTDQLKDNVENGFTLMDGFSDLKNELTDFNTTDVERDIKRLEDRLNANYDFSSRDLTDSFKKLLIFISDLIERVAEPLSQVSEDQELFYDEQMLLFNAMNNILDQEDIPRYIHHILEKLGFHNDLQGLESFKRAQVVAESLNSMMNEVKNLEALASEIPKIEKEMERIEELRDGNEVEEIKNRFKNLITSSDFFKDFRTVTNVHRPYQAIESISPLLQQIKSFSSKMRAFEFRSSRTSKEWFTFEDHFQQEIQPGSLTEKFSSFRECIQNFDFKLSFPMEILTDFEEKLSRVLSLDSEYQDTARRIEILRYEAAHLHHLSRSRDFKTHPSYPDREVSNLEYILLEIRDLIKEMDLDSVRKVLTHFNTSKTFLECYSNIETTASDMKELLVLPGKVWNFDPKVLEGTVEFIGMFKETYKMIEEIKEWKIASNPEIENFPLDGEDVKAVSDGIIVLDTIRNVQNGWKMMKTLDVENSEIEDSWDLLDSSLSQFFEILSSQKIWNLSNVSFPTNLPMDTIRTFIQNEYQEDRRNDILNFLKKIQKLETDFPEYQDKLEKMNEAMGKIKEWDNGKMSPVKEMVDCFEIECAATLKLPEASN
ncbi:hypothetical protein B9Z55_004423 [Caenorhabditis nigoni]|uniref:Domain of unknown function WSN domain-containing protein n=1 Tax=Caenorhabditis nigoni TaxID=1611254 RepID=A0A2G5UWG8_9PELO|nr:hypothetical protein B9Z55_004423 [Caenorhabditis nigoni]